MRFARRPAPALLAALLVAVLVAGCSPDPIAAPVPGAPSAPSDLATLKQQAGIEDCPASDPDLTALPAGEGLPELTLSCLGGGREVHLAGLRGRPMMINVWAQWCPPCRQEAPYLAEVAAGNDTDLLIMGIDYDDPRPDYAIEFAGAVGWTYPQLVDQAKDLRVPLELSGGPPQTLFVASDGTVVARHTGAFTSAQQIRDQVREHLGVRL